MITPSVSMFIGQGKSLDARRAAQAERRAANATVVVAPAAERPSSAGLPPPAPLVLSPPGELLTSRGGPLDLGGRRQRPASAKIRRLRRGRVVKDDDDARSGAPLKTGDVPSRSFVVDEGSGTGSKDLVARVPPHPRGGGD